MNIKAMPTFGQDALSPIAARLNLSADELPLLLGIAAALLLSLGLMLSGDQTPPAQTKSLHLAPVIAGKTAAQLEAELARVNEELTQAQTEREAMLKAITAVSNTLEKKLKEAKLEQTDQIGRQ